MKFSIASLSFTMRCMPSANAKPTPEGSSASLTAFSFFLPKCLCEALASGRRARVKAHQFSRAVLLTSFSMKNLCLVFLICWATSSACFGKDAYQFLSEIPIGGEGGWDILTIDPTANRLYLSHSTKVVVVDLSKNAVAGEIADTPGVHAFVALPELQRGFSSNGKESKSSVVHLTTLKTISKIDTGANPDAVVYEPRNSEVYVFNHTGNSVTVINAKAATVSATIPLGGNPEFAAVDEVAGRVYCNIEH